MRRRVVLALLSPSAPQRVARGLVHLGVLLAAAATLAVMLSAHSLSVAFFGAVVQLHDGLGLA